MPALQLFGDFGFVGGEDTAPNPLQDHQVCINFYPEVNRQNPKEVMSLLGAPGLNPVAVAPGGYGPAFSATQTAWATPTTVTNLPVRGMLPLPGLTSAVVVIGNVCYLMTYATQPTSGAFPTFTLT